MKKLLTLLVWVGLVLIFVVAFQSRSKEPTAVAFTVFERMVEQNSVSGVRLDGNRITFYSFYDEHPFQTVGVINEELLKTLSDQGVAVLPGRPDEDQGFPWVPVVAVVAGLMAVLFFLRRMSGGGGGMGNIFELRKSRARPLPAASKVTFADVGGSREAKEILADLVAFLKDPAPWTSAGARLPRGVLLEGPPGCGKTLLARAVAGETAAQFYTVAASEFVEMFVGVGAARVRDMFETARKNAPAVVFIDELDAVGRRRGTGIGPGHDEREQTLNQLLVCLDGFEPNDRVVVIAATNRADVLDTALVRAGRFDRRVRIPPLGREERLEILRIHARNKPLADDVKLEDIADRTDGFYGAQLESLTNQAALLAVRRTRHESNGGLRVEHADYLAAVRPTESSARVFDKVDAVLIESTSQLAEPTGRAVVRLSLVEETQVEGEIVWADGAFIKIRRSGDGAEVVVPKHQVKTIEALPGTEAAGAEDVAPDPWAGRQPDVA